MLLELKENKLGKDYICPDIHGRFDILEATLANINFDFENDRLLCLGDIIDRGHFSHRALHFMDKKWFYTIRGNHEDMLIKSYQAIFEQKFGKETGDQIVNSWLTYGGAWAQSIGLLKDKEHFFEWYEAFDNIPYAMELKISDKTIVMSHGELPLEISWNYLKKHISDSSSTDGNSFRDHILWSMNIYKNYKSNQVLLDSGAYDVKGVDYAFCGHVYNETKGTFVINNRIYLENNAWSDYNSIEYFNIIDIEEFIKNPSI